MLTVTDQRFSQGPAGMRRRDFLRLAGTAGAAAIVPGLERPGRLRPASDSPFDQGIRQLPDVTFQARLERAALARSPVRPIAPL